MKKCFVVCPIGEDGSKTRERSDKLLKRIIKPACDKCDFNVDRADLISTPDRITNTILTLLATSDLVIADISGHNPNVFYEIGYRHAVGKPTILMRGFGEQLPFDIANIRTLSYGFDIDDVEDCVDRLVKMIESISFDDTNHSKDEQKEQQVHLALGKILDEIGNLKSNWSKGGVFLEDMYGNRTLTGLVLKQVSEDSQISSPDKPE